MLRALFLLCLLTGPLFAADWYQVLGVHPEATEKEVGKAFRRLVLKYHPDSTAEPNVDQAIVKFKEVVEAHEVLGDKIKRAAYDRQNVYRTSGQAVVGNSRSWVQPEPRTYAGGIYTAPEMPEESKNYGHGWFYTTSDDKEVYFDPKTGFPVDFNYHPKTKSEHSELFDNLLNPRNVGKRRKLIEFAAQIKWTAASKKDFQARASETLRAATTDEMFPSNENIRRMKAVFDLPFVRSEFPELAETFLKSHKEYGSSFAEMYLLEPEWANDPKFESLWRSTRMSTYADIGRFPISVFGTFSSRPGPKTGEVKWSPEFRAWYEVHEEIYEQKINHQAFKAVAKMIAEELHPAQVAMAAEQMSWLARDPAAMKEVLPAIRLMMNTEAFKQAEREAKPYDLTSRMIQRLRDSIGEVETLLLDNSAPLALPGPNVDKCGLGKLSDSSPKMRTPGKKPKGKPKRDKNNKKNNGNLGKG